MLLLLLIFPYPAASYVEFNCPGISDCLTRTFFEDFSHYQSLYMRDDINLSRHFLHKHINGCVYPTYFGMDYEEDVDFRTIEIPRWVKKFWAYVFILAATVIFAKLQFLISKPLDIFLFQWLSRCGLRDVVEHADGGGGRAGGVSC